MNKQTDKSQQSILEEAIMDYWQKNKIFEKSLDKNKSKDRFVFYDGPPYANGVPHHGHAVQSIIKDSVTRYKTMRGYYVPRRTGWDTHGLPIEYKIEQEMGFSGKADIIKFGIDKFNKACRESVFTYVKEWNTFFDRIGRWRETDNQYATLDNSYIESVWWTFAQIYKKGYVYEDFRSTPYCPRCATPLSNFEVNLGYKDDVEDPSFYVKFQLINDERKLVTWTTTPWSLPGNAAIAVHPGEVYSTVSVVNDDGQTEKLIIAQKRLDILDQKYEVEAEQSGQELVGLGYEPIFSLDKKQYKQDSKNLYKVWSADFVSVDDGSGILHIAPAFGEEDLEFGKEKDIPVLTTVDTNGIIDKGLGIKDISGTFFKDADKLIIAHLTKQGSVFAAETFKHTYPFCWRCDSPLLYYATTSWFIKAADNKDKLVANNKKINWVPGHIQDGRFGKWLEGAKDWGFSRSRFWGAPLPLWKTEDGEVIVIESIEELKSMAKNPEVIDDLHRPYIDDVILTTKEGKTAHRVEEVFDVWFESGSMPYGQDHYPFENKKQVESQFPADFIAEAMDQTRGWFYSLHVIASLLFDKPAFKNVITTGWVNAADGQKLSKRKKNYSPLSEMFDKHGADPIRYFMLTSPIVHGEDISFNSQSLSEIQRGMFMTLQNTLRFFLMYRELDDWNHKGEFKEPAVKNSLDKWIISNLNQLITDVTEAADSYELDKATRPIREFVDDLSNWFVRRSRRRFWKSDSDEDKQEAYETLYYVLVRLTQVMAPWMPFTAEDTYRKLREFSKDLPESVHLTQWPEPGSINTKVLNEMAQIRRVVAEGLAQRARAGIKVRQPLASINVVMKSSISKVNLSIIEEELNIKQVKFDVGSAEDINLDINITTELAQEGVVKDIIRRVQTLRKKSGLEIDDRIVLSIKHPELESVIKKYEALIKSEVLAKKIVKGSYKNTETININEKEIVISLKKSEK